MVRGWTQEGHDMRATLTHRTSIRLVASIAAAAIATAMPSAWVKDAASAVSWYNWTISPSLPRGESVGKATVIADRKLADVWAKSEGVTEGVGRVSFVAYSGWRTWATSYSSVKTICYSPPAGLRWQGSVWNDGIGIDVGALGINQSLETATLSFDVDVLDAAGKPVGSAFGYNALVKNVAGASILGGMLGTGAAAQTTGWLKISTKARCRQLIKEGSGLLVGNPGIELKANASYRFRYTMTLEATGGPGAAQSQLLWTNPNPVLPSGLVLKDTAGTVITP